MIRNDRKVSDFMQRWPKIAISLGLIAILAGVVGVLWEPMRRMARAEERHERAIKKYCFDHDILITTRMTGAYWVSTGKGSGYMQPVYTRIYVFPDRRETTSIDFLVGPVR